MTKTLLLATLFALVSALPAQAAPQPIFQIERNDRKAMQPMKTVSLFDDGSWTYDEVPIDGGADVQHSGTLAAATMKTLRAELAAATWTRVPLTGARCHMVTSAYTQYRASGKDVWRVQGCGSDRLDDASARAVADAASALGVAWPARIRR